MSCVAELRIVISNTIRRSWVGSVTFTEDIQDSQIAQRFINGSINGSTTVPSQLQTPRKTSLTHVSKLGNSVYFTKKKDTIKHNSFRLRPSIDRESIYRSDLTCLVHLKSTTNRQV